MLHSVAGCSRTFAVLAAFGSFALAQSPLTFGNLLVQRVGDGTAALTNASTAVFVDEYTPAGVLVQTIAMPTAAVGANQPLTNSGTATSEGFLNVSSNGLYVVLTGYGIAPGTTGVATSTNPPVTRVVGRIDLGGNVDTTTALTDAYGGRNIRGVASDDGNRFWLTGSAEGVRFVGNLGDTFSTIIAPTPGNARVLNIYNDQLYGTANSSGFHGLMHVGQDLPVLPNQVTTMEPGFAITAGPSIYDFYFARPTTVYVADDRTNGAGGIQRYDLVGGVWTLTHTMAQSAGHGYRGLSGFTQDGVTTLWATSATTGSTTELVTVVDAGPTSTFTVLATAPTNTAFRGVRYFGVPSSVLRVPASCGAMGISVTGNAQIGTDVVTTLRNSAFGFGFVGFGTVPLGIQFCNCTVVHDFAVLVFGTEVTFPLPNNPAYIGLTIYLQGLDFLAPGGCPDPTFTLTDGFSFTIQ